MSSCWLASSVVRAPAATDWWGWLDKNSGLLTWLFVASLGSLVLVATALPVVIVRLPADYFAQSRLPIAANRGVWHWILRIVKNLLGLIFVLVGLVMIVLPGQGVLTVLIGLLLLEFPGKRRFERWLVRRPKLRGFMDQLRARRGRPPFIVD